MTWAGAKTTASSSGTALPWRGLLGWPAPGRRVIHPGRQQCVPPSFPYPICARDTDTDRYVTAELMPLGAVAWHMPGLVKKKTFCEQRQPRLGLEHAEVYLLLTFMLPKAEGCGTGLQLSAKDVVLGRPDMIQSLFDSLDSETVTWLNGRADRFAEPSHPKRDDSKLISL